MIEEFNQSMDEVKTDIDLLKTRISNEQNQVVSYLEGLISSEIYWDIPYDFFYES